VQSQIDNIKKVQTEQGILIKEIHTAIAGNDLGTKGIAKEIKCNKLKISGNRSEINNMKRTSVLFGSIAGGGLLGIIEVLKAIFVNK
jgi:hypothetical protein